MFDARLTMDLSATTIRFSGYSSALSQPPVFDRPQVFTAKAPPQRLAIFRALQLGDMLCSVPALRALRAALPDTRITLIGLPWASAFRRLFSHYIDDFLSFPGYPGLAEQKTDDAALAYFYRNARECGFDMTIQLHGSGEVSNEIVRCLGSGIEAGFHPRHHPAPGPHYMPWPEGIPEIHRYLALMLFLGVPLRGDHLEFPLDEKDSSDWRALAARHSLAAGSYICLHPGARLLSRRWPIERYAEVAAALLAQGRTVVVTGAADEAPLRSELLKRLAAIDNKVMDGSGRGGRLVDLVGKTMLGTLAMLVRKAQLLICNDTGVSHVAAAVGTASIVLACGSDVRRWAPLDHERHRVLAHEVSCRPCMYCQCPIGHPCALGISTAAVLEAANDHLQAHVHGR